MTCIKFRAAVLSIGVMALLGAGCDKKSPVDQAEQKSNNAAQSTTDAIKDTAQKAVDAGKEGVQKATTLATNVAAKTKEGAQKVESAVTNIEGEIKQKVQ